MRACLSVLFVTALLAACTPSPASSKAVPATPARAGGVGTVATQVGNQAGTLTGHVKGPKGYTAPNATPAPAHFGILTVEELPIANVEVYLASKMGERFKGPVYSHTDLQGHFVITGIPSNLTFLVMTDTKDPAQHHSELCGMTRKLSEGDNIEISYASTIVTLGTIQGPSGNVLGALDLSIYAKAVAAVSAQLDPNNLPDLNDPKAIQAVLARITIDGQPLTGTINQLQQSLAAGGLTADAAQAAINNLNINFQGQGSVDVNGQQVGAGSTQGSGSIDLSQAGTLLPGIFSTPTPTPTPAASPRASTTP